MLDQVIILCLTLQGSIILFSKAPTAFYMPTKNVHGFQFLQIHSNTCVFLFSQETVFFFFKSVLLSLSFFSRKHLKTKQNKHFCTKIGSGFTLFSLITHTLVNIGFKTFSESSLDTWKLKGQKKIELHGGNRKSRESSK